MSDNIVFEDPPDVKFGRAASIKRHLAPLRERPGEWARVYGPKNQSTAGSWARIVRKGEFAGGREGDYEAVSRTVDGKGYVYARYVGNGDDS